MGTLQLCSPSTGGLSAGSCAGVELSQVQEGPVLPGGSSSCLTGLLSGGLCYKKHMKAASVWLGLLCPRLMPQASKFIIACSQSSEVIAPWLKPGSSKFILDILPQLSCLEFTVSFQGGSFAPTDWVVSYPWPQVVVLAGRPFLQARVSKTFFNSERSAEDFSWPR